MTVMNAVCSTLILVTGLHYLLTPDLYGLVIMDG